MHPGQIKSRASGSVTRTNVKSCLVSALTAWLLTALVGCGGKAPDKAPDRSTALVGRWTKDGKTLVFTGGGSVSVEGGISEWVAKFKFDGKTLTIFDEAYHKTGTVHSADLDANGSSLLLGGRLDKDGPFGEFSVLTGRWQLQGSDAANAPAAEKPPGGFSKKSSVGPPAPPAPGWKNDGDAPPSKLDFTGLKGVLAGTWDKKGEKNHRLQFTEKSIEFNRSYSTYVGKYERKEDLLTVTDQAGKVNVYGLEFLSDGEIALRPEKSKNGSDYQDHFNDLAGQWRRVSLPPGGDPAVLGTGPVADAKRLVRKVEALLVKNEAKQKAALAERDGWAAKLRAVGVNSPADLKGNTRGRRIGENMVTLANEIEGRDQQLADLDTALLKANSLVRKLESEEATLTDAERRTLAVQLKEVEERTDKAPLPTTPLDVDAAVEKALRATPKRSK